MSVGLDRQIECVEREIRMRERVYPRWVETGRMKQEKANEELEAMRAVRETLVATRDFVSVTRATLRDRGLFDDEEGSRE